MKEIVADLTLVSCADDPEPACVRLWEALNGHPVTPEELAEIREELAKPEGSLSP